MNRKAISPIISAVLLLAVSLAVVGIFSGWAPELAENVTERTGNNTMETMNCNEAALEIRSAYWDNSNTELNIALRNSGSVDLSDISLVAYDSDEQIIGQDSDNSLEAGNVSDVTFSDPDMNSAPAKLEALSGECGSVTASTTDINQ